MLTQRFDGDDASAANAGSRARIGARWLRGGFMLAGLGGLTLLLVPHVDPLAAAPLSTIGDHARDELLSQSIAPLALGADTGSRMPATDAVIALAHSPERPTVQLTATLGQGDSFARLLQRAGVGGGEAAEAAAMVQTALDGGTIAPGTRVDITLGRRASRLTARPLEFAGLRARFDLNLELVRAGGALRLKEEPIRVDTTPLRIRGEAGASLYRSARAAGAPPEAIQAWLRTIDQKLSVGSDIRPDDTFDMVIAQRRAATGEVETGDLLYAGLERNGRPKAQMLRWQQGDRMQFFEASGVGETRGTLAAPVAGSISSGFGYRRHPILGYRRMHAGLDFRARHGQPIFAVTDGTVVHAGRKGGYGNFVRLSHAGGLGSGYGHMSRIAVSPGERVRRGQIIGYVGSTGLSTGPHLHYELYRNGRAIDPRSVTFTTRALLEGQELKRFRARLEQLKAVEPGAALKPLAPPASSEPAEPRREIDRLND